MNQSVINNLAAKINSKEQKSNKVTSISPSSTDTQYPSAKLLYDTINQLGLGVIDLTSYVNNVSDYDTNDVSLSVTNYDELHVTNGSDNNKPYHTKSFTNNDAYTIQLDIKKPSGTYIGQDFNIIIGEPSNRLEISFQFYNVYFIENGATISQINAIQILDYETIKIHRNLNNWIFDYNDGEITHTFQTTNDIPNKISYCGLHTNDNLYVKNVKLYVKNVKLCANSIVNMIYPIGSIYMSVNSTSPETLFGGTWERLKDRFLLASGDTYNNGATGGSSTVSLTQSQMPRHTHTQNSHSHSPAGDYDYFIATPTNSGAVSRNSTAGQSGTKVQNLLQHASGVARTNTDSVTATNKYTGGSGSAESASNGSAHENMPPYLAVYMWKRIA